MTNAIELTTLSISELKSMCAANSIDVTGDRRIKLTYINAIESFQSQQTVPNALSVVNNNDNKAILHPASNPHRQASIVVLIPLILLIVAVIAMLISIGTLISLITDLGQSTIAVCPSFKHTSRGSKSIDYFPFIA